MNLLGQQISNMLIVKLFGTTINQIDVIKLVGTTEIVDCEQLVIVAVTYK